MKRRGFFVVIGAYVAFLVLVAGLAGLTLTSPDEPDEIVVFGSSAAGLQPATLWPSDEPPALTCEGELRGGPIRFRIDGPDPTSSVGILLHTGSVITLHGQDYLSAFRGIRSGEDSGAIAFHCRSEQGDNFSLVKGREVADNGFGSGSCGHNPHGLDCPASRYQRLTGRF